MDTLERLSNAINSKLKLDSFSHEFYYNSIALCMIDALFSIGVKYTGVKKLVEKFCEHEGIVDYRYDSFPESIENEYTVQKLIDFYNREKNDYEHIAKNVYQNNWHTSSNNGILKAQAVYDFALVLKQYNVCKMADVLAMYENEEFNNAVKAVKGQSSGIMLKYFYMLCGKKDIIKPDRHIIEFIRESTGEDVKRDHEYALKLIEDYVAAENQKGKNYTCGFVDGAIWKYMSGKKKS